MRKAGISILALALATGACTQSDNQTSAQPGANDASEASQVEDDSQADDGDWSITNTVDAITDARIETATAQIAGANHAVEVEVSCINGSVPLYRFKVSSFGMATAFRTIQRPPSFFDPSEQSISYLVRLDQLPAQRLFVAPSVNTNEIVHKGQAMNAPLLGTDFINYLPLGKKLTIRFFLEDGEDTIVVDQSIGGIARVVKPCADVFQTRIAEGKQQRIAREAQAAARQAQIERDHEEIYGPKSAPMPPPEPPVFKGDRPSSADNEAIDE